MTELTAVSLFAGIGGFDLALQRAGVKVVAAVEIDPAARKVLARHFPDTVLFEDVREVTGDALRAAGFVPRRGIVAAGWPCTGNSVAGRREGMADPRSGLWRQVKRLLAVLRPAWFLGENVPGLLSVNGGADMEDVLDDLNDLGYVVDPNIYDAQFFGVPQRRRRVILTCQRLDLSLQQRTITSALTLAQCLTEISLLSLIVLSQGYARGSSPWDSPENCVDGLRKRINLFGMQQPIESICETWLPVLVGASARQALALSTSVSLHGEHIDAAHTPRAATSSQVLTAPRADISLSTASSWRRLLGDLLPTARSCITSTPSRPTTTPEIFTCARALLSISEYTAALSSSSPSSWQPVSSASTAIEVLTKYARSTDGDLLAELNGLHDLVDFVVPAERAQHALRRAGGDARGPVQVLLEPEGGAGHPAPGREARQDIAGTLGSRAGGSRTTDLDGHGASIVGSLTTSSPGGIGGPDDNMAQAGHLIAATVSSKWAKGTGGPAEDEVQNLLPVAFDAAQITSKTNRSNPQPGDPAPSLAATGSPHVAHTLTSGVSSPGTSRPGRRGEDDANLVVETLRSHPRPGSNSVGAVVAIAAATERQVTHALTAEGADASEDGTGRGTPLVPMAFNPQTGGDKARLGYGDKPTALTTNQITAVQIAMAVRRLTPLECERLQGFPDGWTAGQSDAARYRQLGNTVAVPCMQWVIDRIVAVDSREVAA